MNNNNNKNNKSSVSRDENGKGGLNGNINANAKNEKKMAEAEKKSAIPVLAVGLVWILCVVVLRIRINSTTAFALTLLSFAVYQIAKQIFPPKKIEILMKEEEQKEKKEKKTEVSKILTPEERALKDLNERIDLHIIEIEILRNSIDDGFISGNLAGIKDSLDKIKTRLNDEAQKSRQKKAEQLSQFFDYYMPTTIKILNSYNRIEKQNITGENALETKKRVEESLPFIKKAFEKELDNMFSEEMLDITTDIDVIEAMLSKDGLIEKNTIAGIKKKIP